MTAKAHRVAGQRLAARASQGTAVLDRPAASSHHEYLLQLQRDAGNDAVGQLLAVQRKGAPKPKQPKSELNDVIDFLNGFQDLAVAVKGGARGVYAPKFGPDLSDERRAVLERVRRVLIKSTGDKAARKAAQVEWPTLVAKLMAGVQAGRRLGIPAESLTVVVDNIDAIGDRYVKTAGAKNVTESSVTQFTDGVRQLVDVIANNRVSYDLTSGVVPTNLDQVNAAQRAGLKAVKFGAGVSQRHLSLLEQLRKALILARTRGSAKEAVAVWKSIGADIVITLETQKATETKSLLVDIGQKLIHGGLYSEKHNAALANVDLADPKKTYDLAHLKKLASDMSVAKELADKAINISATTTMNVFFKKAGINDEMGNAIWDMVMNPGEIAGKYEEFKKKGVFGKVVSVIDVADKMIALQSAAYTVGLTVIRDTATAAAKAAAATGARKLAWQMDDLGSWASKHLDTLGKIGKVAGFISIGVSVVKVIDHIADGNWTEAFKEAGSTALGVAGGAAVKLGGMGGGALFAGIGVVVAAQMEGISGAAAMIRYAREHNIKEAALDFIHVCEKAASIEVKSMLADMKLLDDPDLADQHEDIQKRLERHLEWWNRHVGELRDLYETKKVNALGGQPALRGSMGPSAAVALFNATPPTWEGLGAQVRDVFIGGNNLAKFVDKEYGPKPKKKEAA